MQRISTRAFAIALSLIMAVAAIPGGPGAAAQTGPGWVSLFDGKTIGSEWDRVGETNWRVEDGAIVADKRTSQTAAHLVTKTKYKDFQVYVEFWASDDANSGIFLRCQDPTAITDRTCYEANIFDQRPDQTYATGGIVHFAKVLKPTKAGGKWNTYEINAKGSKVSVTLNGTKTAELDHSQFAQGPIALQFGAIPPKGDPGGAIKWRKVQIREIK